MGNGLNQSSWTGLRPVVGRAHPTRRRGFTLTEMLVVITVIVLVLAMSVPLFRVMSSDRSVEAGQNIISAMLQRARARAIGLQSPRGIFFFEDQSTKKTAMVLVKIDDISSAPGANSFANVLELDEEAEEFQTLPNGVGAAFLLASNPGSAGNAGGPPISVYRPYGLIVFDGAGRIMTVSSFSTFAKGDPRYPVPPSPPFPAGTPRNTRLWARYKDLIGTDVMDMLGKSTTAGDQQVSHAVMLLYDKTPFAAQQSPSGAPPFFFFSQEQSKWLDNNGLAVSVNRYTGTVSRGE